MPNYQTECRNHFCNEGDERRPGRYTDILVGLIIEINVIKTQSK